MRIAARASFFLAVLLFFSSRTFTETIVNPENPPVNLNNTALSEWMRERHSDYEGKLYFGFAKNAKQLECLSCLQRGYKLSPCILEAAVTNLNLSQYIHQNFVKANVPFGIDFVAGPFAKLGALKTTETPPNPRQIPRSSKRKSQMDCGNRLPAIF